ncbi:orotate phosphoribosyltransferase [Bifidobacterium sp.]|jgi:hypothetical protein|uniref:orotate phosphoribosyltransferase n=1 Tax=Bifidobacterium sp. TaxID=41200 RepID=UPI0025BE0CD4|nr:orotate phosphoribosyltransferase [Bifidobacterium sp.]MCH4209747.1 orotate phosphoribosyltransferase [Bifidobacterium sp.]MCI1224909.1 orotate phosphoribosyltransferase [Bifidobacterium sp.]
MTANERVSLALSGSGEHNDGAGTDAGRDNRAELQQMLHDAVAGRPFSELSSVTFDHRGIALAGEMLLAALRERGFGLEDFDAVGALTAAAVPLVIAVMQAAARRAKAIDGFVMDFVYPSVKGPSIRDKRVILLDSWLSEKSYVQTSSLVTLRNGNELNLDFSIVGHEQAQVLAVVALIGGLGANDSTAEDGSRTAETEDEGAFGTQNEADDAESIEIVNTVNDSRYSVPFVQVFEERDLRE